MDDLAASFAYCRQICQASGSSFFSSFSLLSAQQRDAMYALYAFARITDDLGDSDRSAEEKVADINRWENWLANPTGPPWPPPQIESDALLDALHLELLVPEREGHHEPVGAGASGPARLDQAA